MRFVDDDSNWCVLVICLQISHLGLLQGPQKPFLVLSGDTLALTRMSFKLLPLLKPIKFSIVYGAWRLLKSCCITEIV